MRHATSTILAWSCSFVVVACSSRSSILGLPPAPEGSTWRSLEARIPKSPSATRHTTRRTLDRAPVKAATRMGLTM